MSIKLQKRHDYIASIEKARQDFLNSFWISHWIPNLLYTEYIFGRRHPTLAEYRDRIIAQSQQNDCHPLSWD